MDINEITELTDIWCRMWSENPALAHEVMTGDCVQWSGNTPGLDTVVGPQQQEDFIAAYRAEHVNAFTPRVIIADGDTFAYAWDVRLPDGTVRTGVDVNALRGGLVHENWTFVAPDHNDDPEPEPGDALTRDELVAHAKNWLTSRQYTLHRTPVVDAANGRIALLRGTSEGFGGVDLLTVRDGVVEPIWSVTGTRAFRY